MTRRKILSAIQYRGPMYGHELGGDYAKLARMEEDELILGHACDSGRRMYTLLPAGQKLVGRTAFWRGFRSGCAWPVTLWRRLFK